MARPEARINSAPFGSEIESPDFEAIYLEYAGYVTLTVKRYVHDAADVDDLVQEVFMRAFRSWPALDLDRPIRPWLKTLAEHTCIDSWKMKNRQRRPNITFCDPDGEGSRDLSYRAEDPAEIVHAGQVRDVVNDALDALEPRQRRVLLMKEVDGIACENIATAEGTTAQGLRATLTRARKRFRHHYLALAQERGLGALVFAPFSTRLRLWRQRLNHGATRLGIVAPTSPVELFVPAAAQAMKGLVAVAVLVGATIPAIGSSNGRLADSLVDADSARSDNALRGLPLTGSPADASASGAGYQDAGDPGSGNNGGQLTLFPAGPGSHTDPARYTDPSQAPEQTQFIINPNRQVHDIEDTKVHSYAYQPGHDQVIFASGRNRACEAACPTVLLVSVDGGGSWEKLPGEGFDSSQIFLPPSYPYDNRIFGLTPAGILQVSSDGGKTFRAATSGPQFSGPAAISPRFNSGDPRIVIGTQSGLAQYRDDTRTMSPAAYSALPGGRLEPAYTSTGLLMVGGVLPDENRRFGSAVFLCDHTVCDGTRLSDDSFSPKVRPSPSFAETREVYAFTERAVFRSVDGARSFQPVARPGSEGMISDLAFAADGRLFAAVWHSELTSDKGLWVSADNGTTWSRVAGQILAEGVRLISASGSRMMAALDVSGVACSADSGQTWAKTC